MIKHTKIRVTIRNAIVLIGNFLNLRQVIFLRQYGAEIDTSRAAEEEKLIIQISSIYLPLDEVSEKDKLQLRSFQFKLDELYCQKAEGAFIRSRKRWIEEGGTELCLFFSL